MVRPRILSVALVLLCGIGSFATAQGPVQRVLGRCLSGNCLQKVVHPRQSFQYSSAQVVQFGVGLPDRDGLIVTSVGNPVAVANASSNPSECDNYGQSAAPMARMAASSDRDLRQEFHQAIWEARRAGDITLFQYGMLYRASLDRDSMAKINATAHAMAKVENNGAVAVKFDWASLFKQLLPIILDFIIKALG